MIRKEDRKAFVLWFLVTALVLYALTVLFGDISIFGIFIALTIKNFVFPLTSESKDLVPPLNQQVNPLIAGFRRTWLDISRRPLDVKFWWPAVAVSLVPTLLIPEMDNLLAAVAIEVSAMIAYFVLLYNWLIRSRLRTPS